MFIMHDSVLSIFGQVRFPGMVPKPFFRIPLLFFTWRYVVCPLQLLSPFAKRFFQCWKRKADPQQVAEQFDRSLRTIQRLFADFQERGKAALQPAYDHCGQDHPGCTRQDVIEKVQQLRDEHPTWGAELIRLVMQGHGPGRGKVVQGVPTARTLQRWLKKQHRPKALGGRKPARANTRATTPHETWQVDAKEQMPLRSGSQCSWLRVADEHTGAVLQTTVFPNSSFANVGAAATRDHLRLYFSAWGMPQRMRVDNGPPWGSSGDLPTDLGLWLLGLGIDMIWNPACTPQDNGVIERSNGVGAAWAEPRSCTSIRQLQRRLDEMDQIQREVYPSIKGQSRLAAYPQLKHSGRKYSRTWERQNWSYELVLAHLSEYVVIRRVASSGHVSLYARGYYVGKLHQGEDVYVWLDPTTVSWVFSSRGGTELRTHASKELSRGRILKLEVTHRRAKRRPK